MNSNSQINLTIGVVVATVIAAGGTYFAFDYLSGSKAAPVPAAEPAPMPAEPLSPGEAAAAAGTPEDPYGAAAQDAATRAESGSEASPAADSATSTDSNAAISAATEAAVAAVAQGSGTGLTAEEARKIGEEVARQVAAQVAQAIVDQQLSANAASGGAGGGMTAAEAEQIGLAAGRRAAQQVAAQTAREVVQNEFGGQVRSASSASGSGSSDSSGSESSGSTSSAQVASSSSGRSSSSRVKGISADALKPWWPGSSGGFGLVYAGQPQGEQAIALLFSGEPSTDALNQSVRVYDDKGRQVSGSWESATNPRLAVLRGLKPGRYTVVLESSLADSQGQSLGKGLHGPVYVI